MSVVEPFEPSGTPPTADAPDVARQRLLQKYEKVRHATEALYEPLEPEDCQVQSMPDVSPTKWHIAHTCWCAERFVLEPDVWCIARYREALRLVFTSEYVAVGSGMPRPERGLL